MYSNPLTSLSVNFLWLDLEPLGTRLSSANKSAKKLWNLEQLFWKLPFSPINNIDGAGSLTKRWFIARQLFVECAVWNKSKA